MGWRHWRWPGCGSNTGRSSSGSSSGGKPTLAQWYHQYGEAGTQQAVEKYAKEYRDATVTVQWSPGDYDKKTASALLTDGGPDVFEYGNGPTIDMIKGGQVVDLSDLLGDAKSDFTPSLISRLTYQGKLYGIPQVTDMQLLVYRKSLLSAAGVQPPTTVDELLAAAKKLTTDKVKGLFVGNDGGVGILGGPALWSAGLDYLTEDDQFGFDDPAAVESLRKLRELFTSKSLLLGAPTDWSDPSAFTQGLTAMQFTGLWTFPQIQKALPDDFGVLPWPKLNATTGAPSVPVGAYCSAVSAKSKNVDAAKKFVKWLWVDQTDKQLDWAQSLRLPHPGPQEPDRQGRQAEVRPGRRRGEVRQRERPRPDPAAVDLEVQYGVLRRAQPDHQERLRSGHRDSRRSRRSWRPS